MERNSYETIEFRQGDVKVIVELPGQSAQDERIKQEAKSVLASALRAYLKKHAE